MPATSINGLKTVLKNRIISQVDKVQEVHIYEKSTFDGYPAVTISCSGNENEYWSNAEDMRSFLFDIRVYGLLSRKATELIETTDVVKERTERIMGNVVSQIVDSLDEFYAFSNAADYTLATPSAWGYAKVGNGWCRVAEIKVEIKKLYTIK